ncbi:thioredoxin family protein [Gorillibacterium massiliense]|uniref:thioredoxin family protein n=1 Tax=Gorillibacterium massiliense TaxID=1280390 RepID=UPI0004B64B83|nr:thioredoxin family protein [Gorillibacterium massiliense]
MREFETITSVESADEFIARHPLALLYISQRDCSVCHALQPKVQQLMMKYPKIELGAIDAQDVQEVAGRFSIFTVPVILLFVEGKEYIREARIVHMDLFDEKMSRIYDNVAGSDAAF